MSDPSRAVFLSYASQDTEAAKRICEALRAAGVEVWFDQNELVGGDAWDAKIRGQIKECALFVPIISAATQARREGYFRIEWKLAAQRTHAFADGTPFLLPVVIDTTRDGDALVPEEFRSVQWTRLSGDDGSVKFCSRVGRLLEPSGSGDRRPAPPVVVGDTLARSKPAPASRKRNWPVWAGGLAVASILAGGGWFFARKSAPPKLAEKALAVLPFVISNADAEEERLSDGIADELLTLLGRAPGLRVSGRTSSFSFKGQKVTDAEIARKLGVEFLVAGTFEKIGLHVRIRPQLINAADGSILWGETFTKELTDVFALQDEIAGLIAQKLQTKLGFASRATRTVNPVAYGLVQKGKYLWLKRSDEALAEAVAAYEEAIRVDPDYAEAYAGLANAALVRGWYMGLEGVDQGAQLYVQARAAAQRALALDGTQAEPHAALGALNLNEGDFAAAEREFQTALQLNPNYSYAHHWHAHLLMARGRIDQALLAMERAIQIDPFSLSTLVIGAVMLAHAGHHAGAVALADRAIATRQNEFLPADGVRALSLFMIGRRSDALMAARVVTKDVTTKPRWWIDAGAIYVLRHAGHADEASAHAARLLAAWPENAYFRIYVAAALGNADEALDLLQNSPVPPTARATFYYSEIWEEVRRSPRFPEVMKKLGWWEHYEMGRITKERIPREGVTRK